VKQDFIGEQQYQLADGSPVPSPIFIIRSLKVGDKVVKNVRTSVTSVKGNLLLGQSFLNRFNSWLVDNRRRLLFLFGEFRNDEKNGQGTLTSPDGSKPGIPIEIEGGTFTVPVTINGQITLPSTIDTGASDVVIPADVVSTLYRAGSIADKDFIGEQQYQLADGSAVPSSIFTVRSLKVGDKVVKNVKASVTSVKGNLLLGQSFLNRFNSWLVDNRQRLLFLN
jgi:clan AA aspartic protease (TIGR02281 family)